MFRRIYYLTDSPPLPSLYLPLPLTFSQNILSSFNKTSPSNNILRIRRNTLCLWWSSNWLKSSSERYPWSSFQSLLGPICRVYRIPPIAILQSWIRLYLQLRIQIQARLHGLKISSHPSEIFSDANLLRNPSQMLWLLGLVYGKVEGDVDLLGRFTECFQADGRIIIQGLDG